MMPDKRAFQRFDINTVLEFKLMTALAGVFVGISRNFSYEGFCLETQCDSFEAGDSMEVKLRHPHSDLTVSVPAYVVWKRNSYKFACLMGLKLKETELDARFKMLEIMSAAGDLPVDSFLSTAGDKEREHGETVATAPYINQHKQDESLAETQEAYDEEPESQGHQDEELLNTEIDLIAGKKSGESFNEVLMAAHTEEPETEDMLEDEAAESDMPWPKDYTVEEKTNQATDSSTRILKKLLENRKVIFSSIAAVIIGVAVYALILFFQPQGSAIKSPAPAPAQLPSQTAILQEEESRRTITPLQDTDIKAAAPAIKQPDEKPVSEALNRKETTRPVPAVLPKAPDIRTSENNTKYIQVGAWRDPDNAREMLQKLKKYYPDAYMATGKKLHKIKIPVKNQSQVNSIIKDIEDKFHLKSLVTSEK